jgi:hypothetical protein
MSSGRASRACFKGIEEWLSGPVDGGLTHAELEEQLGAWGRELLRRRAAADVDAFYAARWPGPAPDDQLLVLTCDGKGIVMRPEALRPATAKAAAGTRNKLATRLSLGEKHGRKRMAELACVYDTAPVPRTPGDIITPPGHDRPARKRGPARARGRTLPGNLSC